MDAILSSAKRVKEVLQARMCGGFSEESVDFVLMSIAVFLPLQIENIDSLVDREPRILQPGLVPNALNEMKRILPAGTDVVKVLIQRPEILLSAQNLSNVDRGDRDEYYIAEMRKAES